MSQLPFHPPASPFAPFDMAFQNTASNNALVRDQATRSEQNRSERRNAHFSTSAAQQPDTNWPAPHFGASQAPPIPLELMISLYDGVHPRARHDQRSQRLRSRSRPRRERAPEVEASTPPCCGDRQIAMDMGRIFCLSCGYVYEELDPFPPSKQESYPPSRMLSSTSNSRGGAVKLPTDYHLSSDFPQESFVERYERLRRQSTTFERERPWEKAAAAAKDWEMLQTVSSGEETDETSSEPAYTDWAVSIPPPSFQSFGNSSAALQARLAARDAPYVRPPRLPECRTCKQNHQPEIACLECSICGVKGNEANDAICPGPPPPPECKTCEQRHDLEIACLECSTCCLKGHEADNDLCPGPPPSFTLFIDLPEELRRRIYSFALTSERPISPHLCDSKLKFHDDNAPKQHDSVFRLLGITRVSRQMHAESIPEFYMANTFFIGPDTASFFTRLEALDRFKYVRNVQLEMQQRAGNVAPGTLRLLGHYLAAVAQHEAALAAQHNLTNPTPSAIAALVGSTHAHLSAHPQYGSGGLPDLYPFICLARLSSTTPTPTTAGVKKLVLPIPSETLFTDYPRLTWFPLVCQGLGLDLHFVRDVPVDAQHDAGVRLTWRQKYQKKDFGGAEKMDVTGGGVGAGHDDAMELDCAAAATAARVAHMYPDLERMPRARVHVYMRYGCDGKFREWRDVSAVGGGVY